MLGGVDFKQFDHILIREGDGPEQKNRIPTLFSEKNTFKWRFFEAFLQIELLKYFSGSRDSITST